jgi:hypothetical protein
MGVMTFEQTPVGSNFFFNVMVMEKVNLFHDHMHELSAEKEMVLEQRKK